MRISGAGLYSPSHDVFSAERTDVPRIPGLSRPYDKERKQKQCHYLKPATSGWFCFKGITFKKSLAGARKRPGISPESPSQAKGAPETDAGQDTQDTREHDETESVALS